MQKIKNYDHVYRVSQILNYELATSILFALSFMHGIFLALAIISAVIFAPYLVYVLFKEERYGWVITFIVLMFSPVILSILIGISKDYLPIILMVTLAFFYFYCFAIRTSVKEWIKEYNWARQLEEQKKEKINNQNNFSISEIMK